MAWLSSIISSRLPTLIGVPLRPSTLLRSSLTLSILRSLSLHLVWGVTPGSLLAASGPFTFFLFLPTRVGTGGSYFFFSFCSPLSFPPPPAPDCWLPIACQVVLSLVEVNQEIL